MGTITFLLLFFMSGLSQAQLFYPLTKLQPKKVKKTEESKEIEIPKLRLEGIVHSKKALAVINGRYLERGDRIENCKVNGIFKNSVILTCDSFPVKLTIDLINQQNKPAERGK